MAFIKFVIAADSHGSLVDKSATKKLIEFCDSWKPKHRIHLGDWIDLAPLRKGASAEEKAFGIEDDFNQGMEFLDLYRPNFLTLGNHDDRIYQLRGSADGILRDTGNNLVKASEDEFRRRKITFCEYHVAKYLRMPEGGPKLLHGFLCGIYATKAHHDRYGACVFGHTHTSDSYSAKHVDGGQSVNVPAMANLDALTYADRHPAKLGWRNGFCYGLINSKTGKYQIWTVLKDGSDWISPMGIL